MARWPTAAFSTHRTGCYGCVRRTSADGACGASGYPCVHYGIDLFSSDPRVYSPEKGVVVAVSDGNSAPYRGYGPGVVEIKGVSGVFHLLGHLNLSTIGVAAGDQVNEGEQLAEFDRAIGHTHFEVRKNITGPSDTNTINPELWMSDQSIFGKLLSAALLVGLAWGSYKLFKDELL